MPKELDHPRKRSTNIQNIDEKKNSAGISIFGYENKEKHPIYVSQKCCEEKHVDLLSIGEEEKIHDVLTKDLIRSFMNKVYIMEQKLSLLFTSFQYTKNFKMLY